MAGPWFSKPVQMEIRKKVLYCLKRELSSQVRNFNNNDNYMDKNDVY